MKALFPHKIKVAHPCAWDNSAITTSAYLKVTSPYNVLLSPQGMQYFFQSSYEGVSNGRLPVAHKNNMYARDPKTGARVFLNKKTYRIDPKHFKEDEIYWDGKETSFEKAVMDKKPILFVLSDEFGTGANPTGMQPVIDYAEEHKGEFIAVPIASLEQLEERIKVMQRCLSFKRHSEEIKEEITSIGSVAFAGHVMPFSQFFVRTEDELNAFFDNIAHDETVLDSGTTFPRCFHDDIRENLMRAFETADSSDIHRSENRLVAQIDSVGDFIKPPAPKQIELELAL